MPNLKEFLVIMVGQQDLRKILRFYLIKKNLYIKKNDLLNWVFFFILK